MSKLLEQTLWFLGGIDLGYGMVTHAHPGMALIGGVLITAALALTLHRVKHERSK